MTLRSRKPVDAAADMAKELGLPGDFFYELLREDDWSFVIKCHVLAEAAVIHALDYQLNEHGLRSFIAELPMRNRLKLAKQLRTFPKDMLKRLKFLGKLRNKLAHDVRQYGFTFKAHLAVRDRNNAYQSLFCAVPERHFDLVDGRRLSLRKLFKQNPKFALLIRTLELLIEAFRLKQAADKRRRQKVCLELAAALLSPDAPKDDKATEHARGS